MIPAILKILAAVAELVTGLWKKKNDPSVSQRDDQIEKYYDQKRRDLERR